MRRVLRGTAGTALFLGVTLVSLGATRDNGFDLRDTLIPARQIHHGGPPRDGIPAIDRPRFIYADKASLRDRDLVLGVAIGGSAKAYPIRIMNYHEIVNDRVGDEPVAITYCPLCGTGMAFSARIGGTIRSFGVSGLLYNSDVLLYDRESESLWSQIMRKAVSGPMKGTLLKQLPLSHTTWRDWRHRHPATLVLSGNTGHVRNYARSPYRGYARSGRVWFPVAHRDNRYHPKELVIGINVAGKSKVYPFAELAKHGSTLLDRFGGEQLRIEFDAANRTGRIFRSSGQELPSIIAFWFAWIAFHPDSEVYRAK